MAIEKRFIHFKRFSDFNSKKLSANEANTQYTVGVSGAIQNGAPDILYQSYVWIKDTQQQWTHGQLYDGTNLNEAGFLAGEETSDQLDDVETHTYVKYVPQTLTDEQKAQTRINIDAISGSSLKTINGESIVGIGDITISGGGSSSGGNGAYSEVNHGTSDTTFTLTPNTFHVWDEVSALTLTLGGETSGVANEFLFQFTSGATATTLTLPDDIKWTGGEAPAIEANKIYQISILKGLASVLEFDNAPNLIENHITYNEGDFMNGGTITFEYPTASELTFTMDYYRYDTLIVPQGSTQINIDWSEPLPPIITRLSPTEDSTYKYIL
jgi:hypothetical protein